VKSGFRCQHLLWAVALAALLAAGFVAAASAAAPAPAGVAPARAVSAGGAPGRSGPAQALTATVSISASQQVAPGQTFTATLMLDTPSESYGFQSGLSFNPQLLQCNNVAAGTFYSNWASANGATTNVIPSACDNVHGVLSPIFGDSLAGVSAEGPLGSGSLMSVGFTALAPGTATLTPTNVIVLNSTASQGLPLQVLTGQVDITHQTYLPLVVR
jgi:hypothetical protein